jgi:hypothetical protein
MEKKAQVSFKVEPFEGALSITPVVDGTPLIPEWFEYGALGNITCAALGGSRLSVVNRVTQRCYGTGRCGKPCRTRAFDSQSVR